MTRIRQEMAHAHLPPPEWTNKAGGVLLTLYNGVKSVHSSPPDDFSPRLLDFLTTSQPGETFTREDYRQRYAAGISERSARNDLRLLQEQGYLRQVGRGYQTRYVRTEKAIFKATSNKDIPCHL